MPDSFEAGDAKPGYKGPVNSEGKMVYGKRNPEDVIKQRQHRLYIRQLDGLTPRQLVTEHSIRESIALTTSWRDWKAVQTWNEEDFAADRDQMVSRLTSARWRLFNRSMSKGHFQTAASVLDSLSKTVRDGEADNVSQADVKLNISIEPAQKEEDA
jgi:hypothetical protein